MLTIKLLTANITNPDLSNELDPRVCNQSNKNILFYIMYYITHDNPT